VKGLDVDLEIRILGPADGDVLKRVSPDVFDNEIIPLRATEFLNDPRHHIVAALDDGVVVGFASGVHYVHPDKTPELFVNEVGVAPSHRRRGIGKKLLETLLELGRAEGCLEAWVGTGPSNIAAIALYASIDGAEAPENFVTFTFPLRGD